MIAHIYPSVLQAVSGRGSAGYLDSCFQVYEGEAMQDLDYELRRILIPRNTVNNRRFPLLGKLDDIRFIPQPTQCYLRSLNTPRKDGVRALYPSYLHQAQEALRFSKKHFVSRLLRRFSKDTLFRLFKYIFNFGI
jgi:hypothetical protein